MPLGNWSEAISYHLLKEALKKSTTRWFRLNHLVFAAAEFKAQVQNTSTSKAEGIDGAPQLWALALLKVRITNELRVSARSSSGDGASPSRWRGPRSGRTPWGGSCHVFWVIVCLGFCVLLLFMSLILTQKTVNSAKEEKRIVQCCIGQWY